MWQHFIAGNPGATGRSYSIELELISQMAISLKYGKVSMLKISGSIKMLLLLYLLWIAKQMIRQKNQYGSTA